MTVSYKTTNASPKIIIQADANTGSVVIAGNSTVSNVTSFDVEEVNGAAISQVLWGAPHDAYWTIHRGANLVGVYNGSGHINYSAQGMTINLDADADLSANLVGSTNGTIMIELKKS